MSNLLVQNIKHTNNTTSMAIDTSGQVTIRGESSATTTKLQQGLAKLWCHLDMNTEDTIDDSLNTSSIEDRNAGKVTVTMTNAMASINYSSVGSCWNGGADNYNRGVTYDNARTTTTTLFVTTKFQDASLFDGQDVDCINYGDLA